jgi:thiamine-phosphate pyrophosphorylase
LKGLHLVTDRGLCRGRSLESVVCAAALGGVASVQLREKGLAFEPFRDQAASLKAILDPLGIPLIINDAVAVAEAVGAAGVHVGQGDMPCEQVRRILGPRAIIGLSVETWEDVLRAQDQPVDYLGVSPVFATATKTDTGRAWGLEGLRRIRAFSRHPLVAIGGINPGNIASVATAGAEGFAVVSALCGAEDPRQAAQDLTRLLLIL